MTRATLAVSVAIALGLSLAACGGSSTSEVAQTADAGAVAAELATEPPADHDTEKLGWYESTPTILRGTPGAPIRGQSDYIVTYDDDGVMGMIKNQSPHDVLVQTKMEKGGPAKAILKPGDEMSYKLYGTGELELSKMVDGQVVPDTTSKLWLKDPFVGRPETKFTPPGRSEPANVRTGWKEGMSQEEIWGGIRIGLKRESDGWKIPASEQYLKRYRNPNTQGTPDWAIFTITVYGL